MTWEYLRTADDRDIHHLDGYEQRAVPEPGPRPKVGGTRPTAGLRIPAPLSVSEVVVRRARAGRTPDQVTAAPPDRGEPARRRPGVAPKPSATVWDTKAVLRRMGALAGERYRRDEQPTPDGITLARAALRAWPLGRRSRSTR